MYSNSLLSVEFEAGTIFWQEVHEYRIEQYYWESFEHNSLIS